MPPTDGHKPPAAYRTRALGRGVKLGRGRLSPSQKLPLKMLASELGRTEPIPGAGSNAPFSQRLNLGKPKLQHLMAVVM